VNNEAASQVNKQSMRDLFQSVKSLFFVLCSSFFVLASTSCGDDLPTTPTPPDPVIVTDTFSGTINRNGGATHSFATATGGALTVTLTQLTPDETLTVGLGVGIWNGTICNLTQGLVRDAAVKSTVIYGTVNATGDLCVRIYDVGRIPNATNYEITVSHP
jgi:hypothetical protein